ncbi:hypothetical protein KAJ27_17940 [bacterium]|nr:hypothetical protein [bacterium]
MMIPSQIEMGLKKLLWNGLLIAPLLIGLFLSLSTLLKGEDLGAGQKALTTIVILIMIVSINFSLLLLVT